MSAVSDKRVRVGPSSRTYGSKPRLPLVSLHNDAENTMRAPSVAPTPSCAPPPAARRVGPAHALPSSSVGSKVVAARHVATRAYGSGSLSPRAVLELLDKEGTSDEDEILRPIAWDGRFLLPTTRRPLAEPLGNVCVAPVPSVSTNGDASTRCAPPPTRLVAPVSPDTPEMTRTIVRASDMGLFNVDAWADAALSSSALFSGAAVPAHHRKHALFKWRIAQRVQAAAAATIAAPLPQPLTMSAAPYSMQSSALPLDHGEDVAMNLVEETPPPIVAAASAGVGKPHTRSRMSFAPQSRASIAIVPTLPQAAATSLVTASEDDMLPALDVDATRCTMNAMLRRVSVAPTSRRSLAIARALPQHDRTSVLGRPSLLPASVGGVWLPGLAQPPAHHHGLPTTDASPAGAHDELVHSQTRMRPSMNKSSSCVPLLVDQREGGALVCMDEQALLYENEDAVCTLSRLSLEPHALPVRASRSSAAALLADGQLKGGACAAAQEVLDGALLASVLEWLPTPTLRTVATLVNKTWSTSAATAASWRVASGVMSARLELRPVATAPLKGGRARSGKGGEARGATREVLVLGDGIVVHQSWHSMFRVFPWGRFLSSGAYKKVHQVWNAAARRAEALSVMDVRALAGTGNLPVIQSEIAVGWLLSECVRSRVCPHYVRCYEVALVGWSPEHDFPTMWGSETEPIPQGRTFVPGSSHPGYAHGVYVPPAPHAREEGRGPYQYIRMELCDGGDLETFLRRLEPLLPDASGRTPSTSMLAPSDAQYSATVQAWAFQMCFSLFVARERLALRHYDVKCLNFFLQSAESNANTASGSSGLNGGLEYVIGSRRFQLPWSAAAAGAGGAAWLVKLADYGTCDMQPSTLGGPFKSYHFTTIDNAPPEFFIMGNQVVQAYATDTWALGLTLLHCLTGDCPYEEILASVKCPPRLHAVWRQLWSAHPQFSALGAVLDESNEASAPGGCDFANTLYRILVLTAPVAIQHGRVVPTTGALLPETWHASPLAPTLYALFGCSGGVPDAAAAGARRRRAGGVVAPRAAGSRLTKAAAAAVAAATLPDADAAALAREFHAHACTYNVWCGTEWRMARARRRCKQWPGALSLLAAWLQWDAAMRPSMKASLASEAFSSLQVEDAAARTDGRRISTVQLAAPRNPPTAAFEVFDAYAAPAWQDVPDV